MISPAVGLGVGDQIATPKNYSPLRVYEIGNVWEFPSWKKLAAASEKKIAFQLKGIGLQNQRASRLKKLSVEMSKRNGKKPATRSARSLKEQDAAEESTAILAQIDQLLYSLMNMGGEEGWNDEADYEERTQMKLKEIMRAV